MPHGRTLARHDLLTPAPLHLLVCCSSGNHAAALALAAKLRGIPAYIVVPNNAPACKLAAVKEYGGEQVQAGQEGCWCESKMLELCWVQHTSTHTPARAGSSTPARELPWMGVSLLCTQ